MKGARSYLIRRGRPFHESRRFSRTRRRERDSTNCTNPRSESAGKIHANREPVTEFVVVQPQPTVARATGPRVHSAATPRHSTTPAIHSACTPSHWTTTRIHSASLASHWTPTPIHSPSRRAIGRQPRPISRSRPAIRRLQRSTCRPRASSARPNGSSDRPDGSPARRQRCSDGFFRDCVCTRCRCAAIVDEVRRTERGGWCGV
jgi:hypothetical protein